jgi:hypothetical protein
VWECEGFDVVPAAARILLGSFNNNDDTPYTNRHTQIDHVSTIGAPTSSIALSNVRVVGVCMYLCK